MSNNTNTTITNMEEKYRKNKEINDFGNDTTINHNPTLKDKNYYKNEKYYKYN